MSDISLPDTPDDSEDRQTHKPEAPEREHVIRDLFSSPGRIALYMMLLVLMVAVIVRYELPGEYWAALTGVLTGAVQELHNGRRD